MSLFDVCHRCTVTSLWCRLEHLDSSEVIAFQNECVDAQKLPAFGITHLRYAVCCLIRYDESSLLFCEFQGINSRAMRPPIFAVSAILLTDFLTPLFTNRTIMMNNTFQAQRSSLDGALLTSSNNSRLIEEYLGWKKSYSKSAYRSYRLWIVKFQNFVNKEPEDIKYTDYVAFASRLVGLHSPRGIQYGLSIIHNYLRFFLEQGRLRFPLYLARIPKAMAESHQPVEEADYRKVLDSLKGMNPVPLRDLAIIMLLHDTGLRIGELVSLAVEDLEEDQSAVVRTEKTVRDRRVFWNADTDDVLQRYLVERVNRGPVEECALFVSRNSRHARAITGRTIQRMFKRVLKAANVPKKLSPHSFRHAFIHRLAKLGVPDAIIAQLVGHGSPNAIAHYTKLSRPEYKEYAHKQLQYSLNEIELLAA